MFSEEQAFALGIQYEVLCLQLANLKKLNPSTLNLQKIISNYQQAVDNFWTNVFVVN